MGTGPPRGEGGGGLMGPLCSHADFQVQNISCSRCALKQNKLLNERGTLGFAVLDYSSYGISVILISAFWTVLESNQVKRTPQNYINEFII